MARAGQSSNAYINRFGSIGLARARREGRTDPQLTGVARRTPDAVPDISGPATRQSERSDASSADTGASIVWWSTIRGLFYEHGIADDRVVSAFAFLLQSAREGASVDMTSLAAAMGVSRPTAYELIRDLESRGYLSRERSHDCRRRASVQLTDKAMALIETLDRTFLHKIEEIFGARLAL